MRSKITIGLAALALGAAFTSGPAFAQQNGVPGYSSDGGVVVRHPYRQHRSLFNAAAPRPAEQAPLLGRGQNDGGTYK
jgi:hypothetical protein